MNAAGGQSPRGAEASVRHHSLLRRRQQEGDSNPSTTGDDPAVSSTAASLIKRASGNSLFSKVQEHGGYATSYVCELRPDEHDTSDAVPDYSNDQTTISENPNDAVDKDNLNDSLATAAKMAKIQSTVIVFDYEFVLPHPNEPLPEVIVQDFPKIELGVLHRMAKLAGLLDCDLKQQLADPWMLTETTYAGTGTTMLERSQFLSEDNLIVGLSSFSPDDPDPVGHCEFIANVPPEYLCVPVMGNMTAYYVGDDPKAIQDYLLHHLAIEMNEQRVTIGGIVETYFVGQRFRPPKVAQEGPNDDAPPPIVLTPRGSSRSIGPLVLSVSMALLFTLLLILFAAGRRRNRNRDEEEMSSQEEQQQAAKTRTVELQLDDDLDGVLGAAARQAPGGEETSPVSSDNADSMRMPIPRNHSLGASTSSGGDDPSLRSHGPGPDDDSDHEPPPSVSTSATGQSGDSMGREQSSNASIEVPAGVMEDISVASSSAGASQVSGVTGGSASVTTTASSTATASTTAAVQAAGSGTVGVVAATAAATAAVATTAAVAATATAATTGGNTDNNNNNNNDLPPLPPGGPSAKTAAATVPAARKVKRRKKKKKKKPISTALVRTNSRENIQVMDAIQENEDENDDDEEEEEEDGSSYSGSEYSWSTDETDSRPGSRDPSPVRTSTATAASTSPKSPPPPSWV